MKIFIAGATGRVGSLLTRDLLQDEHEIIAGARHPERVEKNDRVTPVKFDLLEGVAANDRSYQRCRRNLLHSRFRC